VLKVKEPEAPTADEPEAPTDPTASGEEVIGPPYLEKLQAQFLKVLQIDCSHTDLQQQTH
jgi:hypothetical protein